MIIESCLSDTHFGSLLFSLRLSLAIFGNIEFQNRVCPIGWPQNLEPIIQRLYRPKFMSAIKHSKIENCKLDFLKLSINDKLWNSNHDMYVRKWNDSQIVTFRTAFATLAMLLRKVFQKKSGNFSWLLPLGGRGLRFFFLQILFFKPSRNTPWLPKRVLHKVRVLNYVYIVVEKTLDRAEYGSQQSDQPENVNFEPIITGLKSDIFDWDQV